MYLLDTNHCTQLIDGNAAVIQRVLVAGETSVATCVIVRGELLDMVYRSERVASNLAKIQAFLSDIRVYWVDEQTADYYGGLKAALFARFGPKEKSKRRRFTLSQLGVSDNDLWIAAVALQYGLTIVSFDSDFARIQQVRVLNVENWITKTAETNSP